MPSVHCAPILDNAKLAWSLLCVTKVISLPDRMLNAKFIPIRRLSKRPATRSCVFMLIATGSDRLVKFCDDSATGASRSGGPLVLGIRGGILICEESEGHFLTRPLVRVDRFGNRDASMTVRTYIGVNVDQVSVIPQLSPSLGFRRASSNLPKSPDSDYTMLWGRTPYDLDRVLSAPTSAPAKYAPCHEGKSSG